MNRKFRITKDLYASAWDNAFDAMRLVNGEGIMLLVNEAFSRMVEKPREDLIGKDLSVVYQEEESGHIRSRFVERFEREEIQDNIDRPLILHNGKKVWFEASNTYLDTDRHGKLLLSIFRNITDRKKAEEDVRRFTEELKAINAAKDRFFSLISHDLRGPFQNLLGLSELILEELDTLSKGEIQEYMQSLHRTVRAQYSLLENMLSWARLQTRKVIVQPETLQLAEITKHVSAVMEPGIKKKHLRFQSEVADDIRLTTDRNMLISILQNLISNAVKFTPIGGHIFLSARAASEHQTDGENLKPVRRIRIEVRDSGIGIDPEVARNIFDISSTYTRRGTDGEKGTGLGLVLCKEMTEMMGGTIHVDSQDGKGSTFVVNLPENGKKP